LSYRYALRCCAATTASACAAFHPQGCPLGKESGLSHPPAARCSGLSLTHGSSPSGGSGLSHTPPLRSPRGASGRPHPPPLAGPWGASGLSPPLPQGDPGRDSGLSPPLCRGGHPYGDPGSGLSPPRTMPPWWPGGVVSGLSPPLPSLHPSGGPVSVLSPSRGRRSG